MSHPYENLPERAFWSKAVAGRHMADIRDLWEPKFQITPRRRIVTFGSCFAQHFGRSLKARGFNWFIPEERPAGMTDADALAFNYEVFSARTANIYTATLLEQWVDWALGKPVPEEAWENAGRIYDPFRPRIEPNGFATVEEMRASREMAIEAFGRCLREADLFVFTMGLTESWVNEPGGYEYPMCPGTAAGEFDEAVHKFVNLKFNRISKAMTDVIAKVRAVNPRIRFLLTVSPVPLTATNSDRHVLVATMASKSILRAVADSLADRFRKVDYFPSYEIVNSPAFKGSMFEPNMRSVHRTGVEFVMASFFDCLGAKFSHTGEGDDAVETADDESSDVVCEEEILGSFARKSA